MRRLKLVWPRVLLLLGLSVVASAGEVAISPLRVELDASTRISVVRLTNTGPEAITMQATPMAWSQDAEGADQHETTAALIAFPPMFAMKPGQTQVVRIASQLPAVTDFERAYRLFFTEIPELPADDSPTMLRMRLRISIPAFDAPIEDHAPKLNLLRAWFNDARLHMQFRNDGRTHLRARALTVTTASGIQTIDLGKYFLPGAIHNVVLPLEDDSDIMSVDVETDVLGRARFDPRVSAKPTDQEIRVTQNVVDEAP